MKIIITCIPTSECRQLKTETTYRIKKWSCIDCRFIADRVCTTCWAAIVLVLIGFQICRLSTNLLGLAVWRAVNSWSSAVHLTRSAGDHPTVLITHTHPQPVTGLTAAAPAPAGGRFQVRFLSRKKKKCVTPNHGCHTRCMSTHSSISSFSLSHKRTHLDANIHSVHICCIHTTLVPLCLFIPHIMPCISSIAFVFCHSVSLTLASSLSLFFVSFPHFFFLHFALSCSLMSKWLVLEECFLALRRDNKPIMLYHSGRPEPSLKDPPRQKKNPIKSVAAPSKCREEAHAWQHTATFETPMH